MKVAHLPKTRFPVDPPWIMVRDGSNLPKPGQPILFVKDIRGTQEESFFRCSGDKKEYKPEVKFGWVHEIGFSEEFEEWFITVRNRETWGSIASIIGYAEHVHYWQPLPELPIDNYKESEYSFIEIWHMVNT